MLKDSVKLLATKIQREHQESIDKLHSFYSKPRPKDIEAYEKTNFSVRFQFLRIVSIRKIKIVTGCDENETLRESSCTCPDWHSKRICSHLLACLLNEKKFSTEVHWKNQKKRGRKPKVPGALIREENA